MKRLLLLSFLSSLAFASEQPLVTLLDPAGDDVGAGQQAYPSGTQWRRGDLDLRRLDITRDDGGFRFVATFANPLPDKWWLPIVPPHAQASPAMLPFHFNLDLYIDLDRSSGSGHRFTLPGRQLRIDSDFAWERAILLTPQPGVARARLLETLKQNFSGRPPGEAEASIDANMYFTAGERLHERAIAFHVPKEFMAGSDGTNWAITAFVTAAIGVADDGQLGVMPLTGATSPAIDVLLPSAEQQFHLLSTPAPLSGVAWTRQDTPASSSSAKSLAQAFKARLRELGALLDQGLIDRSDYQSRRKQLLDDL